MMIFLAIVSFLIYFPVHGTGDGLNIDGSSHTPNRESSFARKKWISEIIADVEMRFDMTINVSDECRRDFKIYRLHAENQTVWAIRMMESSEWPRIGLFSGATTHLGHYSECLRSRGPSIKGQYCIAQATFNFTDNFSGQPVPGYTGWPEENASAWNVIKEYEKNPFRRSRRLLVWAMCIPSSCTAADLQTSLNNSLHPVFQAQELTISAYVNPVLCTVEDASTPPSYHTTGSYVIEFLTLLTVISTIYDLIFGTYRAAGKANWNVKLVKCFSIVENYRSLTQHSPTNTYRFLYFLKVLFMCIVIWGHAMVMYYMFPKLETEEMETAFRPWSVELLGGVILNAFFMISGFLKAFHFDFSPKVDGSVQFFTRSLAMKYLRMVPMNGLMILLFFFLLPKLEDAPLSSHVKLTEIKYCTSNWWTNMLAIQNLVNHREMCHPHSWYIAADMQLFVIGTLLLIILKKNKKYGICLMILTFLYSVIYSFIKIYSNGSYQLFTEFFTIDPMNYRDSLPTLFAIHTMTFYRVGPYLIGYVTAFITKSLMEKGFKFSSVQSVCLLLISSLIGFGIQLYGFVFFMVERQSDPIEMAVFGVLQPILFVLPFASLICIYFVSGLGIFKPVFESTFYIPLGRLSYSVYLVGLGIQCYHIFNQRKMLPRFSRIEIYWWMMGDIFFVLALAIFFYFTCEGPVNNLINLFIKPYLVKKKNILAPQEEKKNNASLNSQDGIRLPQEATYSSVTKITESVRGRITRLSGAESILIAKQTCIKSEECSKKKSK